MTVAAMQRSGIEAFSKCVESEPYFLRSSSVIRTILDSAALHRGYLLFIDHEIVRKQFIE
jgi:hypothetical protein